MPAPFSRSRGQSLACQPRPTPLRGWRPTNAPETSPRAYSWACATAAKRGDEQRAATERSSAYLQLTYQAVSGDEMVQVCRPSYFTELLTWKLISRGNLFGKIFGGTVARADGTAPGQLTQQPVTETYSSKLRSNSRLSTIEQAHLRLAQNTELRLKRKFERDLRPPSARRTMMAGTSPVFTRSALQVRWTRLVTAGAAPAMVSVSTGRKRPRPRLGAVRISGKILRRKEKEFDSTTLAKTNVLRVIFAIVVASLHFSSTFSPGS